MFGYYGYDPYLILLIPAFLFSLYAQFKVKNTFSRYSKVFNSRGLTGAEVARAILDENGLGDVAVSRVNGQLTDHYDPRTRIVNLSDTVFGNASVAAIGVAAHETGHALQHRDSYAPLGIRSSLVPVANIGSSIGPYMAVFGIFMGSVNLTNIGILLFSLAVAFYLVTLPVEFNASRRAVAILETTGMLSRDELVPVKKVLGAAAMTYVASAAVAMASLLRLVLLAGNRRRD